MELDNILNLRIRESDLELIHKNAAKLNIKTSTFARSLLIEAVRQFEIDPVGYFKRSADASS